MEQNLLLDILRILTPEEISELATTSEAFEKRPLTAMMECYFLGEAQEDEEQAKILPFEARGDEDLESEEDESVDATSEAEDVEHVEEPSEEQIEKGSRLSDIFKVEEVVVEEKIDIVSFILEEKEKFKKSRKELKGREVLKLYESNASVSVEQERKNKKNLSKSAHSGVLINKRQA